MIGFIPARKCWVIVYPHYIRNRSKWNAMWRDNQPQGYGSPILFPHSAKCVRDCSKTTMAAAKPPWLQQNHHDCSKTTKIYYGCFEMLSWPHRTSNNIINMFLVARDLDEMFVLHRGKHTTRSSTVGIWNEVRVYRTPAVYGWATSGQLGFQA